MGDSMQFAGTPLHGKLTLTGYDLPAGLTFDEWAAEGSTLVTMARASMWWIGDWIRYGEHKFGEKYAQAIEVTGLSLQTLTNAVWVCERIPPKERHAAVPFWTHQEAARVEDRSSRLEILDKAESEGLTQTQVRREVLRHQHRDDAANGEPQWVSVRVDDLESAAATLRRHLEVPEREKLAGLLVEEEH